MIIVCSGPDTYRARERARELVAAFKEKHDPNSLSTFILATGQDVKTIFSNIGTPSLFTTKKLIRCDGLLETLKIAEVRTLVAKLQIDGDQTILLTVEEEPPSDKILETLKPCPLHHYAYPLLKGQSFLKWLKEQARIMGVSEQIAEKIAGYTEGDSWLAKQELFKRAAYPEADQVDMKTAEMSHFEVIEDFLLAKKACRERLSGVKDDSVFSLMQGQIKSYIRARDGFTEGLHPFVVKKMRQLKINNAEQKFKTSVQALRNSRSGLCSGNEMEAML